MASLILIQVTSMVPWLEKCPVSSYQHLYCYLGQKVVPEPWYEWQLQGVPVLGIYRRKFPLPIHKPARIDALKLAFQYLFLCLLGSLVKEQGMFWVAVLSGMPLLMHGCIFSVLPAFRVHLNSISEEVSTTSSLGWSTCLSSNKQAPVSLAYYTTADAFLTAYQCALCIEYIDAHNSIRKHN